MAFKTYAEKQLIIVEIKQFMAQNGGRNFDWYCGIAADPGERLFNDHNVDEQKGAWIERDCGNVDIARKMENIFLESGCRGGAGGGDESARFIYVYKITPSTKQ
ncbi:MAG: hypothetical protein OEV42_12765 [Deltaproteobacteria bacterium]|nr:hypothetical protein [Deltaproteobacteria bacterium]